jgi:hypothetical protein
MNSPCVAFGASPRGGATPAARQSRFRGVLGFMRLLALVVGVLLAGVLPAAAQTAATPSGASHGLGPLVTKARGGQCVDDPAFMRRNHMALLKHQRDDTVHGGIRAGKYSLKACVACHASEASQSVSAEAGDFCQSCHTFAAVKIDCFGCHASKPPATGAQAALAQPQVKP